MRTASCARAGRCARSGKAQLIEDVGSDPDYVPGNVEVKSEYLVPIQHRTRLHGVLNLESTRADFFGEEVRATFDAVAAQIAGAIHLARVARALELANLRLEQLSMSDGLTGIANRRCFDHRLLLEWERHADNGRPLALLLVDVDCFKALNDAHGHLHGDECLRRIAQLCAAALDDAQGIVARYGGEEFALLLTDCAMQDAHAFAEQLRLRVEDLALCNPRSHVSTVATVSVGIGVVVPSPARDPQFLVAAADQALYSAKNEGRNRVCGD